MLAATASGAALDFAFSGSAVDALSRLAQVTGYPCPDSIRWAAHPVLGRLVGPRWLNKKVNVNVHGAHLPEILAELASQTGAHFGLRSGYISSSYVGRPIEPSDFVEAGPYTVRAFRETYEGPEAAVEPSFFANMLTVVVEIWADTLKDAWKIAGISNRTRLVVGGQTLRPRNAGPGDEQNVLLPAHAGPAMVIDPRFSPLATPRRIQLLFDARSISGGALLLKGDVMVYEQGPWSVDIPVEQTRKPYALDPAKAVLLRYSAKADYVSVRLQVPGWMEPTGYSYPCCDIVGVTEKGREASIETVMLSCQVPGLVERDLPALSVPYSLNRPGRSEKIRAIRIRLWWVSPDNGKAIASFSVPVRL